MLRILSSSEQSLISTMNDQLSAKDFFSYFLDFGIIIFFNDIDWISSKRFFRIIILVVNLKVH